MSKSYDRGRDTARMFLDYDRQYPDQAQPLEEKINRVEANEAGAPREFQRGYLATLREEEAKRER